MEPRFCHALVLLCAMSEALASDLARVPCGSGTIGQMVSDGWRIVKMGGIKKIERAGNYITLEDESVFRADMTSGMLVGDDAVLLSKYVTSPKLRGYIYTICAGGFDAWVTPIK